MLNGKEPAAVHMELVMCWKMLPLPDAIHSLLIFLGFLLLSFYFNLLNYLIGSQIILNRSTIHTEHFL